MTLWDLSAGRIAVCATAPTATSIQTSRTCQSRTPPPVEVVVVWPTTDPHPQAGAFADFARGYFTELINSSTPPMLLTHSRQRRRRRRRGHFAGPAYCLRPTFNTLRM